jgi:hypothetical protein
MAAPVATVTTSNAQSQGTGELAPLENSQYDFSSTRYPLSVGTDDAPHYMVFNINLPDTSKYLSNSAANVNVNSASQSNYDLVNSQGGKTQASAGQAGQAALGGAIIGVAQGTGLVTTAVQAAGINVLGAQLQIKPKLQRIAKSIALYMPDTLAFSYEHDWQASSITDAMGLGGTAAALGGGFENVGKNLYEDAKALGSQAVSWVEGKGFNPGQLRGILYNNAQGAEAVGTVAQALGAGSNFTGLALRAVNKALNPQIEMVFHGTQNRNFVFEFNFQPRSAAESADILDILNTFRMYAAPELSYEGNGRYFVPPAQFDIGFYFKNVQNAAIPKISTCALVSITYDFNHSGSFATFDDGMPVHIYMQLMFKEMDVIYRELIAGKGY